MEYAAKEPRPAKGKKRLHIFDFDQTMFQSPGPPPDVPEDQRGSYWHDPESLGGENVPSNPNANWYITHIIEEFRKAQDDPDAVVTVMTGRSEPLRERVEKLLEHMGLKPDELILKQKKEPTSEYKIREMRRLLDENPGIEKVHFYEDREHHLKEFQEAAEADGYEFEPHFVPERDADKTWENFLEIHYEGGAKQVKNTNMDTRDRFPKVRADHLVRTDPEFARLVRRQFKAWVSMGKPHKIPSSRIGTSKAVLRLTLDVGHDAVVSRIARRFLLASTR